MVATLVIIILAFMRLGIYIAKHGETQTVEYKAGIEFLALCIKMALFYYAGLFDKFIN